LPELAEVKSVICRVTKPKGAVVLNADDDLVADVARRVKAPVLFFSLKPRSARVRRHLARGGRAFVLEDDGWLVEREGAKARRIMPAAEIPATVGGMARHNVANALAAAGGARALGFSIATVRAGLSDVRNSANLLPGRLNLYRLGNRVVIVDYAHNVAGLEVLLDTCEALIGKRGKRRATLTVIFGSAGDRPDDYLRELAATAGSRADQVALKEMIPYLRGRTREGVLGELRTGLRSAGVDVSKVPVYTDEIDAIRGELTDPTRFAGDDSQPRLLLALSHRLRDEINALLLGLGAVPVEDAAHVAELRALMGAGGGRSPESLSAPSRDRPAARTRRR
jgi:cyanophycin synthetase